MLVDAQLSEDLSRASTPDDQLLVMARIARHLVDLEWFSPQPVGLLRLLLAPSRPAEEPQEAALLNRDLERRGAVLPLHIPHVSLYLVQVLQPDLALMAAALSRHPTARTDEAVLGALLDADMAVRRFASYHLARDVERELARREVSASHTVPAVVEGLKSEAPLEGAAASFCLANFVLFESLAQEALDVGALPLVVGLLQTCIDRTPSLREGIEDLTHEAHSVTEAAAGAKAKLAQAKLALRMAREVDKPEATAAVTRCRSHLVSVLDARKQARAALERALEALQANEDTLLALLRALVSLVERWPRLQREVPPATLRMAAALLGPAFRRLWTFALRAVGALVRGNAEAQAHALKGGVVRALVHVLHAGDDYERKLATRELAAVVEGAAACCVAVREAGGVGLLLDLVNVPFTPMEVFRARPSDVMSRLDAAFARGGGGGRGSVSAVDAPSDADGPTSAGSAADEPRSGGSGSDAPSRKNSTASSISNVGVPGVGEDEEGERDLFPNPLQLQREQELSLRAPVHPLEVVAECCLRDSEAATSEVLTQAGLGAVVDLLRHANPAVSVPAARCLAVLARSDAVCHRLRQLGGVPQLLAVCVVREEDFAACSSRFQAARCTLELQQAAALHTLALASKAVNEVQDDVRDFGGALERLVELLQRGAPAVRVHAAIALANVSDGNAPNQDLLRSHGMFPSLVEILVEAEAMPPSQRATALCTNVARCLSRATVGNAVNQLVICRAGGIPPLVALAQAQGGGGREGDAGVVYACEALANSMHDQTEVQMALLDCDGLRALIGVATFSRDERARVNATRAIGAAVCKFPRHKQLLRLHNGVQPLVSMAVSGSEAEVAAALDALHHAVSTSLQNKKEVARVGGVPAMIRLAERGTFDVQLFAIAFLPSMLKTVEDRKRFVALGGVQPLLPHLTQTHSPVAVMSAMRAIKHLGLHAVDDMLARDIFPVLVRLLSCVVGGIVGGGAWAPPDRPAPSAPRPSPAPATCWPSAPSASRPCATPWWPPRASRGSWRSPPTGPTRPRAAPPAPPSPPSPSTPRSTAGSPRGSSRGRWCRQRTSRCRR